MSYQKIFQCFVLWQPKDRENRLRATCSLPEVSKHPSHLGHRFMKSRHINRVITLRRYLVSIFFSQVKLTCLLFVAFPAGFLPPLAPSMFLKTSMKSLFETEDISFARFLSEPPALFTSSSIFFWCVLTALNNCTTPLGQGKRQQSKSFNSSWFYRN